MFRSLDRADTGHTQKEEKKKKKEEEKKRKKKKRKRKKKKRKKGEKNLSPLRIKSMFFSASPDLSDPAAKIETK